MLSEREVAELRRDLLTWFDEFQRDLPWRRTKDPYAIWVSEAMLQQTRVAAVLPYYERFLTRFPDFQTLAAASESDLLAQWAGLGYYYRARNLQKAAQSMVDAGAFPTTYDDIRLLPGVGDYTAAAVASIAFDLPHAVLDGNVFRVLSRLIADPTDISSTKGRKHFSALANSLLDRQRPGAFNQAVMELGATVCLSKNPQCLLCPAAAHCLARQNGSQNLFPVNKAKQASVRQQRTLFWIESDGAVLAWQRPADSRLMPGFWELPERAQIPSAVSSRSLGSFRHGITVHSYAFDVVECKLPWDPGICQWLRLSTLGTLPVSTIFKKAMAAVNRLQKQTASAAV
ncbi:MAG: A/G-specific adenine glycosylase [Bryobacterales bacterium]|nr:A/G-specific adenine glycosylase [Bryobacterales bacterium]